MKERTHEWMLTNILGCQKDRTDPIVLDFARINKHWYTKAEGQKKAILCTFNTKEKNDKWIELQMTKRRDLEKNIARRQQKMKAGRQQKMKARPAGYSKMIARKQEPQKKKRKKRKHRERFDGVRIHETKKGKKDADEWMTLQMDKSR